MHQFSINFCCNFSQPFHDMTICMKTGSDFITFYSSILAYATSVCFNKFNYLYILGLYIYAVILLLPI